MSATSQTKRSTTHHPEPLRILLTNGRFPVSLDLARQFQHAGHTVFCVDPLGYPLCKFSLASRASVQVPAPHDNPEGYVRAVKEMVRVWRVDLIMPVHEEIFYLAGSGEPDILARLFAPPFDLLLRLHHPFEFSRLAQDIGLDVPEAHLCTSVEEVRAVPMDRYPRGIALTPVFGRASAAVHHLRPGQPVPENIDIGPHNPHVAQEWLVGDRYCSYSIVRGGHVEATGCYPVLDTIDGGGGGGGSVSLQQKFHPPVYEYVNRFVAMMPPFSGQIAFDVIETADGVFALACHARATSAVHLWSQTPDLARAITGTLPHENIERPVRPPRRTLARTSPLHAAAGPPPGAPPARPTPRLRLAHLRRRLFTRDLTWTWRDPMPTLVQPLLLTAYRRAARKHARPLPALLQCPLTYHPRGDQLHRVHALLRARKALEEEEDDDEVEHDHDDGDDDGDDQVQVQVQDQRRPPDPSSSIEGSTLGGRRPSFSVSGSN